MTDTERSVALERTDKAKFHVTNVRGGTLEIGEGQDADFTPVELLLVAIAGCSGITVDQLTSKRVEPDAFAVSARADKIRDELGNRLTDIQVTFDITFPDGPEGDRSRETLPRALAQTHDRLCTVVRTVVNGTPIEERLV